MSICKSARALRAGGTPLTRKPARSTRRAAPARPTRAAKPRKTAARGKHQGNDRDASDPDRHPVRARSLVRARVG